MANIMINKVCNLQCPYCFANEFVNKECVKHESNISIDNFKKALDFAVSSGNGRVGIIGGEPLLHPNFEELMRIAIEDSRVRDVVLFTNGILLEKYLDIFQSDKIGVLVNLNSPKVIGEENYNKIIKGLDRVCKYGNDKISLGINMYKEKFDYKYMIDALKRYNKHDVRTAIAVPNTDDKKNENALEYFKRMKDSVFKFFMELEDIEVAPRYDCNNMPLCVTSAVEKRWLENFWRFENYSGTDCNILENPKCSPVVDILPDLQAVRCFGCSNMLKVSIDDFDNLDELIGFFEFNIDDIGRHLCVSEDCKKCRHYYNNGCNGGCFAFKKNMMMSK